MNTRAVSIFNVLAHKLHGATTHRKPHHQTPRDVKDYRLPPTHENWGGS